MDAVVSQWVAVGVNVDLAYLESSEWLQQLINQTLPDGIMNIGLNWYLADNTTSMWGAASDPAFAEMTTAKNLIANTAEREAEVKRIVIVCYPVGDSIIRRNPVPLPIYSQATLFSLRIDCDACYDEEISVYRSVT